MHARTAPSNIATAAIDDVDGGGSSR